MKYKQHMTLSQRKRYNEYCRIQNIRHALSQGRIPQPRKDVDYKIMNIYREEGLENAVVFPQSWMDSAIRESIKEDMKAIRARIRNMLPAIYSRKRAKIIADLLLSGQITVDDVKAIK